MPKANTSPFFARAAEIRDLEEKARYLARGDVDAAVSRDVSVVRKCMKRLAELRLVNPATLDEEGAAGYDSQFRHLKEPLDLFGEECCGAVALDQPEFFEEIARVLRDQRERAVKVGSKWVLPASHQLAHDIAVFACVMEKQGQPLLLPELCAHLAHAQYKPATTDDGQRHVRRVAKQIGIVFAPAKRGRRARE